MTTLCPKCDKLVDLYEVWSFCSVFYCKLCNKFFTVIGGELIQSDD